MFEQLVPFKMEIIHTRRIGGKFHKKDSVSSGRRDNADARYTARFPDDDPGVFPCGQSLELPLELF